MNSQSVSRVVVAVLIVLLGSSTVYGAEGFYIGASGGISLFEGVCEGIAGGCDDEARATKVYGGRQFGPDVEPNMGLEVAYVSLGQTSVPDPSLGNVETKVKGYSLTAIGAAPVAGPVSLIGRFGLFLSSLQARASGASTSESAGNSALTVGLGVRWTLSTHFFARLEWELFSDLGDNNTGTVDVDLFSTGVGFAF